LRRAVAFTGPSNSGKTTLIEKISKELQSSRKVAIIKHDPKDKAIFDREGKDSHKFFQTGADVAVVSPTRTTIFLQEERSIEHIASIFGEFDLLMVEGLKHLELPRVAIFRGEIDTSYLSVVSAIAIDDSVNLEKYSLPSGLDILNLNDTYQIIRWIDRNAKILKG
jgi:molybdopterin-guanine dinucleotide biosynthesis protein B